MNLHNGLVQIGLIAAAWCCASDVLSQVSITPGAPRLNETVRVRAPQGISTSEIMDFRSTQIRMDANKITVSLLSTGTAPTLPEPSPPLDIPIGQFPVGEYQVEVRVVNPAGAVLRVLGQASFSIAERKREDPLWNLTDLWWNPDESGWGLSIVQGASQILFVTWYVYGDDGKPTWYAMSAGRWIAEGVAYAGAIHRTTGPQFCYAGQSCPGLPFDPGAVTRSVVGEGSISLNAYDYDRILVTFTIDGKTLTRNLRRFRF